MSKLLDLVRSGVGAIFRGLIQRRDAQLKIDVQKIRLRGQADLRQLASELQVVDAEFTEVDSALISSKPAVSLPQRAQDRLNHQEQKRQLNVESIVATAAEDLSEDVDVSDDPVDEDWVARFFGAAQDVSSQEMQALWGKLLAGEVRRPGSFSLRCLDTLRNLAIGEARLFKRVLSYALNNSVLVVEINGADVPRLQDVMRLSEAGLLNPQDLHFSFRRLRLPNGIDAPNGRVRLEELPVPAPHRPLDEFRTLQHSYSLTAAGFELARLLRVPLDAEYLKHVALSAERQGVKMTWEPTENVAPVAPPASST